MINRYCWLPVGGKDNASSRLRCFNLHEYFIENGINSKIGYNKSSNMSIIQKRLDCKALLFSYLSWKNGSRVILDIDDLNPGSIDWVIRIKLFANIVDGITAATDGQLKIIKDQLSIKQRSRISFFSFENPIDYSAGIVKYTNSKKVNNKINTVCWFGNSGTFNVYIEVEIVLKTGCRFLIISDKNPMENNADVDFIAWNRLNFPIEFAKKVDICILSHYGSGVSMAKSANKMVASIALEVPVIASKTPAYSGVAQLCGASGFLYNDTQDFQLILKRLMDSSERERYIDIAKPRIIDKFSISSVSLGLDIWCKKLQKKTKNIFNYILVVIYLCLVGVYNKSIAFLWKK